MPVRNGDRLHETGQPNSDSTTGQRIHLQRTACFNCRASRQKCDRLVPWYVGSFRNIPLSSDKLQVQDVPLKSESVRIRQIQIEDANKVASSKSTFESLIFFVCFLIVVASRTQWKSYSRAFGRVRWEVRSSPPS